MEAGIEESEGGLLQETSHGATAACVRVLT